MKKLNLKKTKFYWLYLGFGIISLVLGVMLLPIWQNVLEDAFWVNWGIELVSLFMAFVIGFYLFTFLVKKINNSRGVIQVLTIIEFVILTLIAVGLVFKQFNILPIAQEPSVILGVALYSRGVIEVFRAYYHQKTAESKYPIWWLVTAIMFITIGVYLMFNPVVKMNYIVWTLAICVLALGVGLIVVSSITKPAKVKKANGKKQKVVETKIVDEKVSK